ncbi:Conserved hypothetical membrane protein [Candidatus Protochlamydia naegleriophila]|uniref:Conserved hypothetical membrane protein n=1 Tax=Candidatus Protochlamydia naegleriophila TaxID=389348 RepID=A0A0U5K591_9BACT|nr:hypothetical protein [Candidatus Protochlamydia naegleriophila]CUI17275.1 Conserved hypothetical membrane protein [Candidatus Protochlamydia naegleriophila]
MTNIYIPKIDDLSTTLILTAGAGYFIHKLPSSFNFAKIFLVQIIADNILFQMVNLTFNRSQNRRTSEWIYTGMNFAVSLATSVALHQLNALRPIGIAGFTILNFIVFASRMSSIYQEQGYRRIQNPIIAI